jgi:stage II sporulation protein P
VKAIHQVHGYEYEATGNYRTTDLNYSVARVGTELTNYLKEKGFNVTHNTTYHDYPAYSGSYARSLNTLEGLLEGKNTQLVFDLHRDAVGSSNEYAPTIKINDNYVAQIMFVIGTNGGGLEHPNWVQNLKIAVKIQEKANEMYPGLFRPIIIRNSRYNQHLTNGSSIIEVGATGNTMEQCILSMQCLSNVLAEVCK